jgi:hypothetical protein
MGALVTVIAVLGSISTAAAATCEADGGWVELSSGKLISLAGQPREYVGDIARAGEYVVAYPPNARLTRATLDAAIATSGLPLCVAGEVPGRGVFLLVAPDRTGLSPAAVRNRLAQILPENTRIEPNIGLFASANQDLLGGPLPVQWALRNIGPYPGGLGGTPDADVDGFEAIARQLHGQSPPARRPIVAVMDSGLDTSHPDFGNTLWRNAEETPGDNVDNDANGYVDDVVGWDFVVGTGLISDFTGHGTHVSGIIAARSTPAAPASFGLAPHALIMPLRILTKAQESSSLQVATLFSFVGAFTYARAKGADVVNMSFETYVYSQVLADEIALSHAADLIMVAAAGNGLPTGVGVDVTVKPVYPCVLPYVVCVAATDEYDRITSFSNFGVGVMRPAVVISAPGANIVSTRAGGGSMPLSGTSMASPMVAATFAALKGLYPLETNSERRSRVFDTADRIAANNQKVEGGRRLNVYQALFGTRVTGPQLPEEEKRQSAYCLDLAQTSSGGPKYPRWQNAPFANSGEPGITGAGGTTAFTICTARQLMAIDQPYMSKGFHLAQDIDWAELGPGGGYPIGAGPRQPGQPHQVFNGTLSGQDHSIFGLRLRGIPLAGLFAELGPKGSVIRLQLRGVDIEATGIAGGIAAKSSHTGAFLSNFGFEGEVIAGRIAGGLIGEDNSVGPRGEIISGLNVNGVIRSPTAGGILGVAGRNMFVRDAHALVSISDATTAGGIVGNARCGVTVSRSYANGQITATDVAGGVVGELNDANIEDSYASIIFRTGGPRIGGAIGVIRDGLQSSVNGQPGPFLCRGVGIPTPPNPSKISQVFYDSSLAGGGGLGQPKTASQLKNPAELPKTWLKYYYFQPGFMPALNWLPRSFRIPTRFQRSAPRSSRPVRLSTSATSRGL